MIMCVGLDKQSKGKSTIDSLSSPDLKSRNTHKVYPVRSSPRFIGSSTMSVAVTNPKYLWCRMGTEHSVAQRKVEWLCRLKFDVFAFINSLCPVLGLCELSECCGRRFHTLSACVPSIQHLSVLCPLPCAGLTPRQPVTHRVFLFRVIVAYRSLCGSPYLFELTVLCPFPCHTLELCSGTRCLVFVFLPNLSLPTEFLGSQLMLLSADVFVIKNSKLFFHARVWTVWIIKHVKFGGFF